MTVRIVVYAHRPKRPPKKQKPSAMARAEKAAAKPLSAIVKPTSEKQPEAAPDGAGAVAQRRDLA